MKAAIFHAPGAPEVLKFEDVADPTPASNQVVVKLEATSLNHVDIWVRQGLPAYPVQLPHVLGADGAGTIESCGDEVEGISVGDRVLILPALICGNCNFCKAGLDNQCERFEILGAKRWGTYAEKVTVPDQNVVPLPDPISFDEAASFPLAYLTAWHMLISRAKLEKGETLLVTAGSSGVSAGAIQIAKAVGARVLATTSNAEKVEAIKGLGAEEVFAGPDFSAWAKERTNGKGVDVILEHVGPATFEQSLASLKPYGRLVTCGATSGPAIQVQLRTIFGRDISILGARMGTHKEFIDLSSAVFSGKIKPKIGKVFALSEAADAHRYLEDKKNVGKVLLKTT